MMKKLLLALALGSTALAGALPAFAQTAAPARDPDRVVTREEAIARADKMFDAIDANHDGKITAEERKAARDQMRAKMQERRQARQGAADAAKPEGRGGRHHRGGHGGKRMGMGMGGMGMGMRGDPNRVITREEARQKAIERFDRMDLNHDGKITADERKAARDQMREKMRERWQARRAQQGAQPAQTAPAPAATPRTN